VAQEFSEAGLTVDTARLVDLFFGLARIPSPSGSEGRCAEAVISHLGKLGIPVTPDGLGAALGSDADNLYARLEPRVDGTPLFLCAHLDTVPPSSELEPQLVDGVIRNATPSIVGADNKAALAVILEVVHTVSEHGVPHAGIELVFTIGEEQGLVGSSAFDCSRLIAHSGYVLDHPGPVGGWVESAPSRYVVRAEITGRAAHSAIAPADGRNAILPIARSIAALPQTDEDVNVNVARVHGGDALNVVPDRAGVVIDVRSTDDRAARSRVDEIRATLQLEAAAAECELEVSVSNPYSAYRVPATSVSLELAMRAFARCGLTTRAWSTRGGSDANAFCKAGLDCINLTHAVEGFHALDERVAVADLELMANVMLEVVNAAVETGDARS
jgi:tripeptide aminopeptidase